MLEFFPGKTEGSIGSRLAILKKQKLLPKNYTFRIEKWDEGLLIKYAEQNLTVSEMVKKIPNTTENKIKGRLSKLREEGKLPSDYVVRSGKTTKYKTFVSQKKLTSENIIGIPSQLPKDDYTIRDPNQYFDLNERMSKIETAISIEGKNKERQNNENKKMKHDISFLSSELDILKQKKGQIIPEDLGSIIKKISSLEQRIIKTEAILEDLLKKGDDKNDYWDAFRQASEFHNASELLKIIRDAETIIVNKES